MFGRLIGYLVYLMIKSIEQHQIEVMLTLALVIGPSGSGKSTFLRCLNGRFRPARLHQH